MAEAITHYIDSNARVKRVYYEGTSTIYEGMPLCYNFDTTDNMFGWGASSFGGTKSEQGTTAEGEQNEGKHTRTEGPASANYQHLAGYVVGTEKSGTIGPCWLNVYIPNGAIVPVRVYANCVAGSTLLGITEDGQYLKASTGDDDPVECALAMETVNRSSVAGLCLCKIFPTGQVITGLGAVFAPTRSAATGDSAGIRLYLDNLFVSSGTTGPRTYGLYISGSRDTAYALTTGGCDDAGMRISITNYAPNGSVYNFRGINVCATNREDGTCGELDNIISVSTKTDAGVAATVIGLKVDAEHLAPGNPTEYGGLDVALCREGGAATTEYGIQVRTRGTINTAVTAALRFDMQATDYGFSNLFSVDAAATLGITNCTSVTTSAYIPIKIGSTTYKIPIGTTSA